jgi:hypothetical protein
MTKEIAERIIKEIADLETLLTEFCHYNRLSEEITFMENATEIFKKHINLSEEEEMLIRVAMSVGYSARSRTTKNERRTR